MSQPDHDRTSVATLLSSASGPAFSFEFYPPRTPEEEPQLWRTVGALGALQPHFVSVTYGANGSNRERTIEVTRRMAERGDQPTIGHLTCVAQSKAELAGTLEAYHQVGVRNILAIRGDMPGAAVWQAHPDGLANATELVRFIKDHGDFCVGVAAFPNAHLPADDPDLDAQILLDKVRAGAEFAITQLFFDASSYLDLIERMRGLGCEIPIVPGIMPLTVITQIERFADLAGRPLPEDFVAELRAQPSKEDVRRVGLERAVRLCEQLLDVGAPGLQFFTQNRAKATLEVLGAVQQRRAVPALSAP